MSTGLQTHIWNNNLKSLILLGVYPFLIAGIVFACAYVTFSMLGGQSVYNVLPTTENMNAIAFPDYQRSSAPLAQIDPLVSAKDFVFNFWPMIFGGVALWFVVAYFFHTKMIRHMSHSHPVTREEEPELYNLFENLCISIGMKMPRLEIIETHARNAFASGINEKSFAVTVTRGLLQSLSKDEVEGVLAHELTHIQNRDVRLLIITIIFTGMIGFAAQFAWSQLRYGMWFGRSRGGRGSSFSILIYFAIVAILWLGYMATLFTRFAISRRREFMADAGAVQMTRNPDAMMRALMRIAGKDQIPKTPGDIAMMCIENRMPFMGLFKTHPPIEKRIKALSDTTGFAIPDLPQLRPFHAPRAEYADTLHPPEPRRDNWVTRQRFKKRRNANPWA